MHSGQKEEHVYRLRGTKADAKSNGAVANVMPSGESWEPCTTGATEPKGAPEGWQRLEPAAACGQMGWPWWQYGGGVLDARAQHICISVLTINPLFHDLSFCILL